MICPGTGLSPCRALLQHRYIQWTQLGSDNRPTQLKIKKQVRQKDLLFLGFRNKEKDFLYGSEWEHFEEVADIHVAFSRDDPYKKFYVQDCIEVYGRQVSSLLVHHGAFVYVCGQSHPMPSQVRSCLVSVLEAHQGCTNDEAEAFLLNMERQNRYICDTWG